ncbi:hypothetical protein Trydic_g7400 [Trypoxylus dichotomus]
MYVNRFVTLNERFTIKYQQRPAHSKGVAPKMKLNELNLELQVQSLTHRRTFTGKYSTCSRDYAKKSTEINFTSILPTKHQANVILEQLEAAAYASVQSKTENKH